MARLTILLLLCGWLCACIGYQPAPSAATLIAQAQIPRAIDRAAVAAERMRLGARPAPQPDRLDLVLAAGLHNPAIRARQSALLVALAANTAAGQAPSPSMSLLAEYAQHAAESSPWQFGFGLDLPLDYGQRRTSRQDAANTALLYARCDLADASWTIRSGLRRDLGIILASERRIALLRELGEPRALRLAALTRRADAGEIAGTEVDRVRLETASDSRLLREAQNSVADARQRIAAALGIGVDSLQIEASVWPDFLQPELSRSTNPAPQDVSGHPDLLRAIGAYEQSDSDLRLQLARQYPGVSIGPGYAWERGLIKLPLNVGLALPPLDLNRSAIGVALSAREAAAASLEETYARVSSNREQKDTVLQQARRALSAIRNHELPAMQRIARRATAQFEAGEIDRGQWASARIEELGMQLAETDAVEQLRDAETALEEALHRAIEGPELEITAP